MCGCGFDVGLNTKRKVATHVTACFFFFFFALSKYSSIAQRVSVVCRLNRSCWLLLSFTLGGALLRVHYRHEDWVWRHVRRNSALTYLCTAELLFVVVVVVVYLFIRTI